MPEGPLPALVAWALRDGPPRLQHALFDALARAQLRLPFALLPQALELGRRSVALRTPLLAVLGERGLWLAAHSEAWSYAAGVSAEVRDEARWSDGSPAQRRAFLEAERARDPAAARERFTQTLPELAAKERADLLGALSTGLGLDDEALLDRLRADRSREVRQAATALLLRLPQAAHPQRAASRIDALLTHERVLLRKRWLIDAPAAIGEGWAADNIEPVRPKHESLGERAWWLYQLVRQVPLAWWTRHTGLDAASLRTWADGTEWTEALLRGWHEVLLATPDEAWCEAFLDAWPERLPGADPAGVLALLPLAARERHWQAQLRALSPVDEWPLHTLITQMLTACPAGETLSLPLSGLLTDLLHERAASGRLKEQYALRQRIPELACVLHPDALGTLARLPRQPDKTASHADTLATTAQVVALRTALRALPSLPTASPP